MRVVIAPDSFKGSISADRAARSIAEGWASIRPEDELDLVPMADGGEGTVAAIRAVSPTGILHEVDALAPDGADVAAQWLEIPSGDDSAGSTAVIEFATSSGIGLLEELRPLTAHSYGFGQVIEDALDRGCRRLLLGIGGSASTDGGHGMLTALGARFTDDDDENVGLGNLCIGDITHIDTSRLRRIPDGTTAVVLSDVTNPLLGEHGAVAIFGPQKGISESISDEAEAHLAHFAEILATALPAAPDAPGAGAAGGTGFALAAWGAHWSSGAAAISELLGLPERIASADLVIAGEGSYDEQSRQGKVVGHVLDLASLHGTPCALVAGRISASRDAFVSARSLSEAAGSPESAMTEPERWLREAGAALARTALP